MQYLWDGKKRWEKSREQDEEEVLIINCMNPQNNLRNASLGAFLLGS